MIQRSLHLIALEGAGVFALALAFILILAPSAPFTRELGVCESGAVRDVLAGNPILPRFIPGPIVHVPPLYWWTAALAVRAFGWNELALRIPSIVAAAATCAILYGWVAVTLSRRAGLWAAAALLLSHFFLDAARQPRMDSMLALFVTAAAIFLERALRPPAAEAATVSSSERAKFFTLAACFIGLGILSKGILGIVLPGAAVGAYLVVRGRWRELARAGLIAAFGGGLAIGLAWYVAGYEVGGSQFLHWQVAMNLWSRFLPADAGGASYCANPFWYFAPHIATGFLPWSLFIPALAVAMWRWRARSLPEPVVYALCWFASIFIFFSLSRGKCLVYILPAFPPLAVLIGWLIQDAIDAARTTVLERRLFAAGGVAIACGMIVIVAAAIGLIMFGVPGGVAARLHPTDRRFLEIFAAMAARRAPTLIAWLIACAVGAVVALAGLIRRKAELIAYGTAMIAAAGCIFWFGAINPQLAKEETLASFARAVVERVPADAQIGHIGIEDCDLYFYSSRPIEPVFRFRCDADPPFPTYIVIRRARFDAMASEQRACLEPIMESSPVDNNGTRLLVEQRERPH